MSRTDRDPSEVLVRYTGPRPVTGAPARDLTRWDVARITYRRAFASTFADGIRPPQPAEKQVQETAADLVARGPYTHAKKE